MQTKEDLINSVKEWLLIDNQISDLQKQIREKRKLKKELSNSLITVMKEHNIDCLDIKNATLVHTKRKQKQSISKKFLLETLEKYYNDNEKSTCMNYLPLGSKVSVSKVENGWCAINVPKIYNVKFGYVPSNHLVDINYKNEDWVSVAEQLVGLSLIHI